MVDGTIFHIRQCLEDDNPTWEGLDLHKRNSLAVIILVLTGPARKDFNFRAIPGTKEERASEIESGISVIVESLGEPRRGIRCVKYLLHVNVMRKRSHYVEHPSRPWSKIWLEEMQQKPVAGVFLPYKQRWCVS
jgi:hypothetical protein